jgi:DNA-binding MarR family transcriptional regulator
MSKQQEISAGERRYEIIVGRDEFGLEHLTLARLIDIAEAPQARPTRDRLQTLAYKLFSSRRARARFFNNALLGEPVWDMLLALYCLPPRNESLSVTGLIYAAEVPQTTGHRWIQLLMQKGLIERRPDPADRRRFHMQLTQKGEKLMEDYLSSIFLKITER